MKGISSQNWAINLLLRVIMDGHKEGTHSTTLSDWVIPMELKWDIEKFLESLDE